MRGGVFVFLANELGPSFCVIIISKFIGAKLVRPCWYVPSVSVGNPIKNDVLSLGHLPNLELYGSSVFLVDVDYCDFCHPHQSQ